MSQQKLKLTKKQEEQISKEVDKRVRHHVKKHLKEHATLFGSEFRKQTSTALIAAFGFLIALTWRDFISKIINDNVSPGILASYPYLAALYTALIVTIIGVIGIALITRWFKSEEKTPKKS